MKIKCSFNQGQYRVQCISGELHDFLITSEDLGTWKTPPLLRHREALETVEQVIEKLNSSLHEVFFLQQGFATIVIVYDRHDNKYGLLFSPSIVHGISCGAWR